VGYAGWVITGVIVSACGGALAWFEKPLLDFFHPLQLNFVVRIISVVLLSAVTVPLTLLGGWSLVIETPPAAAAWIAMAAFFEWTIALSAFYYALRVGTISVVTPIVAAAPLFTALFGVLFLGERPALWVYVGMVMTVIGIVVLTRWMPTEEEATAQAAGDSVTVAAAASADPPPDCDDPLAAPVACAAAPQPGTRRTVLLVVLPALLAALTWGAYPVLVEAAERAADGPTVGMMIESQLLGAVFLIPFMVGRRARGRRRPPPAAARRRIVWFLAAVAVLEVIWGVFFYFMVENLGAIVTGVLIAVTPVFSVLGGILIWKERLNAPSAAGAALAVAGVIVAALGGAV